MNDIHKVRFERAVDGYLRRMAARLAIRERNRARRSLEQLQLEADPEAIPDSGLSPEELAEAGLLLPRLADCFSHLSPQEQHVLWLFYWEGLSVRELAAAVDSKRHPTKSGVSATYAGRLLKQALEQLRRCLENKTCKEGQQS
jgi:RNA polymerase sigma factor (sigma-70 family)